MGGELFAPPPRKGIIIFATTVNAFSVAIADES